MFYVFEVWNMWEFKRVQTNHSRLEGGLDVMHGSTHNQRVSLLENIQDQVIKKWQSSIMTKL